MVKKFVFHMFGNYKQTGADTQHTMKRSELGMLNDVIHNQLVIQKNNITAHHKSRRWDKYKKLTNDYELVFTSAQSFPSIAAYLPISRSYFKLWEILTDFRTELNFKTAPMKSVFLADAPGGFGEAFINFRNRDAESQDTMFGMSLRATNKIIPDWKFDKHYCTSNNLTLCYGKSGTGNLYNIRNIHDLIDTVGRGQAEFVTADGGFDFSSDFNSQENMSINLILCEIYATLCLQQEGGSFVLKIYDIHSETTIKMLYVLKLCYEHMYFMKPLSSRPANSEKYVVCTHFKRPKEYERLLTMLSTCIIRFDPRNVLPALDVPLTFTLDIIRYNKIYILQQAIHIMRTISMIETSLNQPNSDEIQTQTNLIKQQITKAIKWCHKYDIPVSFDALKKYKPYYLSSLT